MAHGKRDPKNGNKPNKAKQQADNARQRMRSARRTARKHAKGKHRLKPKRCNANCSVSM